MSHYRGGLVAEHGELRFTMRDFERIRDALQQTSGIDLPESRTAFIYSRLTKRLRALRLRDFTDYCNLIEGGGGAEERRHMLSALTTNLTRFYREPHHFTHLAEQVLPSLVARARSGGRIRLWSAGCSTGAEPCTVALTVSSVMPDAAQHDVRVLATDIDGEVLAHARRGQWHAGELEAVPVDLRARWFTQDAGGLLHAKPDLQRLMAFRELNLTGQWPMTGRFDAIFCRNVAIYFDAPTQQKLWSRLADHLLPGGMLYIGHSERISGPAADLLRTAGVTIYQKTQGRAG